MPKSVSLALLAATIGLASRVAAAATEYKNPAQHYAFTVPDGLVPLSAAELARANATTAARGGTPTPYEAGCAPLAVAGAKGQRLPLVLIRFVPGQVTMRSLADSYRADLAKTRAAESPHPTSGPAAVPPTVTVDEAAHTISVERQRTSAGGGEIIERDTIIVGHDGVAEVDWTGNRADTDAKLPRLLASFKFDKGYEYAAPDVYRVTNATNGDGVRRMMARAILLGAALLFLAVTIGLFLRARQRNI